MGGKKMVESKKKVKFLYKNNVENETHRFPAAFFFDSQWDAVVPIFKVLVFLLKAVGKYIQQNII